MSSLLDFVKKIYEYDHFENEVQLKKLKEAGEIAEGIKLLSHVADAKLLWHERLQGNSPLGVEWKTYNYEVLEQRLKNADSAFQKYLSTLQEMDMDKIISYKNIKGDPFSEPLKDILFHVANHGTHHRGQISTILRQNNISPEPLDYIAYVRKMEKEKL